MCERKGERIGRKGGRVIETVDEYGKRKKECLGLVFDVMFRLPPGMRGLCARASRERCVGLVLRIGD